MPSRPPWLLPPSKRMPEEHAQKLGRVADTLAEAAWGYRDAQTGGVLPGREQTVEDIDGLRGALTEVLQAHGYDLHGRPDPDWA